jgi:hypothetical protein
MAASSEDMVAGHKAKLSEQKELERKEKELANKEREFDINVLEIKKHLGITIKKQGDETRDDLERCVVDSLPIKTSTSVLPTAN